MKQIFKIYKYVNSHFYFACGTDGWGGEGGERGYFLKYSLTPIDS